MKRKRKKDGTDFIVLKPLNKIAYIDLEESERSEECLHGLSLIQERLDAGCLSCEHIKFDARPDVLVRQLSKKGLAIEEMDMVLCSDCWDLKLIRLSPVWRERFKSMGKYLKEIRAYEDSLKS